MIISQVAIAFTGTVAIWLANSDKASERKYAPLFGLAGQPFWMYSAFTAEQWGILVLTIWYTLAWARGVKNNWMVRK